MKKENEWIEKVKQSLIQADKSYQFKKGGSVPNQTFGILKGKIQAKFKLLKGDSKINFIVERNESNFSAVSRFGRINNSTETNHFLYGYIGVVKLFPRTLIRPETFDDKLWEIIQPIELDFKKYLRFSRKYYVLTEDKEMLKASLSGKMMNCMAKYSDLIIELGQMGCLFRSERALEGRSPIKLIEFGFKLKKIITSIEKC